MNMQNITTLSIQLLPAAVYLQKLIFSRSLTKVQQKRICLPLFFRQLSTRPSVDWPAEKPIRGHIAFLGGPLHFLSELKQAFIRTLKLDEEHTIVPENSHLFAAIGSALNAKEEVSVSLSALKERMAQSIKLDFEVARMEPLFASQEDYDAFNERQSQYNVATGDLASYEGNCFLGIDAGSTTTKAALVGEDGSLLSSFYDNNNRNPLATTIRAVQEIYSQMPDTARSPTPAPPVTVKH